MARLPLLWALLGIAGFGGGIVSCRHGASIAPLTPSPETLPYEYQQARLLETRYAPATNRIWALVQLPDTAVTNPVRMVLIPEQHALFYARLTRAEPLAQQVPVAYSPARPDRLWLADSAQEPLDDLDQNTSFGITYNTLGILLCSIGSMLGVMQLTKYFDQAND